MNSWNKTGAFTF